MEQGVGKHVIAAVALFVLDCFGYANGSLAVFIAVVMVVIGLVEIALSAGTDRPRWLHGIRIVAIYVALGGAVFGTVRINGVIANERAHRIVAALDAYHARYGRYPDRLADLVPDYLPKVPVAKYTALFHQFQYAPDGLLSYAAWSPFARVTYRLDTRTWGYQD